ncbi:winged helix-turn-helix transcriptional regulator [Amycolatopsis sp. NPDC005232]|uniref:winged helix-turn-helix transcriptional regulator n=1 Tax=Amycolatopsis sp. NPDC005232 TaxID=3157027 RepID=UPI0033A2B91F
MPGCLPSPAPRLRRCGPWPSIAEPSPDRAEGTHERDLGLRRVLRIKSVLAARDFDPMLTLTLKQLQRNGFVERILHAEARPRVEYRLTHTGGFAAVGGPRSGRPVRRKPGADPEEPGGVRRGRRSPGRRLNPGRQKAATTPRWCSPDRCRP